MESPQFCAADHVMLFACFALPRDPQATKAKSSLHLRLSTSAPASMVLSSYYNILYLLLHHAGMNWTGGQLRRHSAGQGILSKTQKEGFAKSRQQANRLSRQPSTPSGVPDLEYGDNDRLDGDATCRNGQMTGGEAWNQSVALQTVHHCWPSPTRSPSPVGPLPLESLH